MENSTALAAALELVGPRLREIRELRGLTLTGLSARTGISKRTLSRVENGQRRPSLELLPRSRKPTESRWSTWLVFGSSLTRGSGSRRGV